MKKITAKHARTAAAKLDKATKENEQARVRLDDRIRDFDTLPVQIETARAELQEAKEKWDSASTAKRLHPGTHKYSQLETAAFKAEKEAAEKLANLESATLDDYTADFRAWLTEAEATESVDTMELWYRAHKAADHIKADRIHGRELDDAFENCDGDEMCAALWRMAQKSEKLMAAIRKAWKDHGVRDTFETNAAKYATLTDKELSQRAAETRERFSHPSAWITE